MLFSCPSLITAHWYRCAIIGLTHNNKRTRLHESCHLQTIYNTISLSCHEHDTCSWHDKLIVLWILNRQAKISLCIFKQSIRLYCFLVHQIAFWVCIELLIVYFREWLAEIESSISYLKNNEEFVQWNSHFNRIWKKWVNKR